MAQELTPESARKMFGAPTTERSGEPDDEQRRAIAVRHGLPAGLGDRLRGATLSELEADAAAVAALTARTTTTEPETTEQRARAQLGVSESKAEWAAAFVKALHPPGGDEQ